MFEKASLREKARELLTSRRLPERLSHRLRGTKNVATAARCRVCRERFAEDEMTWEARFDGSPESSRHYFHLDCHAAFEAERQRLQRRGTSSRRVPSAEATRGSRPKTSGERRRQR